MVCAKGVEERAGGEEERRQSGGRVGRNMEDKGRDDEARHEKVGKAKDGKGETA